MKNKVLLSMLLIIVLLCPAILAEEIVEFPFVSIEDIPLSPNDNAESEEPVVHEGATDTAGQSCDKTVDDVSSVESNNDSLSEEDVSNPDEVISSEPVDMIVEEIDEVDLSDPHAFENSNDELDLDSLYVSQDGTLQAENNVILLESNATESVLFYEKCKYNVIKSYHPHYGPSTQYQTKTWVTRNVGESITSSRIYQNSYGNLWLYDRDASDYIYCGCEYVNGQSLISDQDTQYLVYDPSTSITKSNFRITTNGLVDNYGYFNIESDFTLKDIYIIVSYVKDDDKVHNAGKHKELGPGSDTGDYYRNYAVYSLNRNDFYQKNLLDNSKAYSIEIILGYYYNRGLDVGSITIQGPTKGDVNYYRQKKNTTTNTSTSGNGSSGSTSSTSSQSRTPTITVTKNAKYRVKVGTNFQILLNGATAKSFKSSKRKVASVSSSGFVTPLKPGKTKVTVKLTNRKRYTVTLNVYDPTIPTSVSLNMSGTNNVKTGDTVTLTASLPSGTSSGIKWKSNHKSVATVSNGVVKFKKKGSVTITATTTRGNKKAKVKFKVTK